MFGAATHEMANVPGRVAYDGGADSPLLTTERGFNRLPTRVYVGASLMVLAVAVAIALAMSAGA